MKLVVAGCMGRMGSTLMHYIAGANDATLVGGAALAGHHPEANRRYGALNALIKEDVRARVFYCDCKSVCRAAKSACVRYYGL